MSGIETFDHLPEKYDPRVTDVLRQPLPADVIVGFYYMAAAKNPSANYRWELRRDGRLFLVHHSGKPAATGVTYDRPLPAKPAKVLTPAQMEKLRAELERAKFFEQPELQMTATKDGAYVIVRARRGEPPHEVAHDVVYQNVEGPLVDYLYTIAD